VELNPAHARTLNDLSNLYARSGKLDEQLAVLSKALARSPQDDDLVEAVLGVHLMKGDYASATRIVESHTFAPRHRTYGLRDKYRMLRYAEGTSAFKQGDYARALQNFESARKPPVSLGMDDFESQVSPRLQYYLGRAHEAMGHTVEATQAYQKGLAGVESLSGDRDSWNSENWFMVASLVRLGRTAEADRLEMRFEDFSRGELQSRNSGHRAEAHYLLALITMRRGKSDEARQLLARAMEAQPDFIAARLEFRGDTLSVARTAAR
jgi:tetratricopeptide (TPR) repeat protein